MTGSPSDTLIGARRGRTIVLLLVFAVPVGVAAFFFIGARFFGFGTISGQELVAVAEPPAALAATSDGGLLYGERTTGRVYRVARDGARSEPLFEVAVQPDGQRGLLGLAVDGPTVFMAWVDPSGMLLVGRSDGATPEVIWRGPTTSDLGNGGHIEIAPDGSLVVGIGDLQEPGLIDDPAAPNGKLLVLDPEGPPEQEPEVLSSGWHNPFAFDFTPDGSLWVADNAPGETPERLARGDGANDSPVTELDEPHAPSALVAVDDTTLVMCGFLTKELSVYRIDAGGRAYTSRAQPTLATDCEVGAVLLSDGRIAYSAEDSIRIAPAP